MNRDILLAICSTAVLLALGSSSASHGANLAMVPQGNGSFALQGNNASGVSSFDLTLNYDASTLAHPQFSVQGGTVTTVTNADGGVSVHVDRDDPSDDGLTVYVTFDQTGDRPGVINFVTASLTDSAGGISAPLIETKSLGEPSKPSPQDAPLTIDDSSAAGPQKETVSAETEKKPGETARKAAPDETGAHSPGDETERSPKQVSVIQKFKNYSGTRGLKEFSALFPNDCGKGCRQEPPIAISDGTTPVRITIDLPSTSEIPPLFSAKGAKLLRTQRENDQRWNINLLPDKEAWDTRLVVRYKGTASEFTLVVAPPISSSRDGKQSMTAEGFLDGLARFAAEVERADADYPRYLTEYLYTANFLAAIPRHTTR